MLFLNAEGVIPLIDLNFLLKLVRLLKPDL